MFRLAKLFFGLGVRFNYLLILLPVGEERKRQVNEHGSILSLLEIGTLIIKFAVLNYLNKTFEKSERLLMTKNRHYITYFIYIPIVLYSYNQDTM